MNNFVMIYHLEDENANDLFMGKIIKKYPHYQAQKHEHLLYICFEEKNIAKVNDEIHYMLQKLNINQSDYVAIYYRREENDDIKQYMVLGSDSLIEGQTNKISGDMHTRTIDELLGVNFMKIKS